MFSHLISISFLFPSNLSQHIVKIDPCMDISLKSIILQEIKIEGKNALPGNVSRNRH